MSDHPAADVSRTTGRSRAASVVHFAGDDDYSGGEGGGSEDESEPSSAPEFKVQTQQL